MLEVLKDFKKYIIGGVLLITIVIGSGFLICNSSTKGDDLGNVEQVAIDEIKEEEQVKEVIKEPVYVYVDVKGAVKKPGVYKVLENTLISDVIKLAELKSNGTTKNINLSKKVVDEMVINVLTVSELKKLTEVDTNSNVQKEVKNEEFGECVCKEIDVSSCNDSSVIVTDEKVDNSIQEKTDSSKDSTKEITNSLVSLNNASKEELMTLSGIGESKALAIIKYREDNNGFKCPEEIMNVSGIGEALYNKIKDHITI